MPDDDTPQLDPTPKKRLRVPKTLAIVVGVTVVEGIGFYAATKLFGGGPQIAYGVEGREGHLLDGEEAGDVAATVEIELLSKFKAPNDRRGRLYIYDFDVALKVPGYREEEATQLVSERHSELSDRVARVVRSADPAVLHEPTLKTLRVQLRHVIGEVVGDQDLIVEVLIPRCVPLRAD